MGLKIRQAARENTHLFEQQLFSLKAFQQHPLMVGCSSLLLYPLTLLTYLLFELLTTLLQLSASAFFFLQLVTTGLHFNA